eukprot:c27561_g1_i1.p1 GENE.c27561_g1_i1~~c27561_g1_i1.p1  ORF type:complete len:136 (-),score=21.87 c27561_g1_i1:24-431(-)
MSLVAFFIVGKQDKPLYQLDFFPQSKAEESHFYQFIAHAALDVIDESIFMTKDMNLKVVDSFNDMLVSAFVTASYVRLIMVHKVRADEAIKNFFQDVYELYIKLVMNPFYEINSAITSQVFDARVKAIAKRYFAF